MPDQALAFQFAEPAQQRSAATLGVWVFLGTEVLFFGGLILAYTVYRSGYAEAFRTAARHTDIAIGVANTAILLTSSAAMALGAHQAAERRARVAARWITAAALLGLLFLGLKGFEYANDAVQGLVPGSSFALRGGAQGAPAELFFILYFVMTGLHALHLSAGIGASGWISWHLSRARGVRANAVEGIALYWHFVDLVWVFLFALLYLGGRS